MTEPNVRKGLALLGLGVALVVLLQVLKAAEVGEFGAPSDIGGGLVALAGAALIVIGLGFLIQGLLDRRSKK